MASGADAGADPTRSLTESAFPGLAGAAWRRTSDPTQTYNCIGWAAGDDKRWWWPHAEGLESGDCWWPEGVPVQETIEAFVLAYGSVGFAICDPAVVEKADGDVVAVFTDTDGKPTHAARRLPPGLWTSKLGNSIDIEHGLHDLEGKTYGKVRSYLLREWKAGSG